MEISHTMVKSPALTKAHLTSSLNDKDDSTDSDFFCRPEAEGFVSPSYSSARVLSHCLSTKQSIHFSTFYHHHSLKVSVYPI